MTLYFETLWASENQRWIGVAEGGSRATEPRRTTPKIDFFCGGFPTQQTDPVAIHPQVLPGIVRRQN